MTPDAEPPSRLRHTSFSRFSVGVLAYTIITIVFGAFVRASHSGDGCGANWPLCEGEVIPTGSSLEKYIEFAHRVSTGLLLPAAIIGVIWAWRKFGGWSHPATKASFASLFFILVEAGIGAGLVLTGYVAMNTDPGRIGVMGAHLVSTFLLLGAMSLAVYYGMGGRRIRFDRGAVGWAIVGGLVGLGILGFTGAITALGATIFHGEKFIDTGLANDLAAGAHPVQRLRILHPIVATTVGFYLLWMAAFIKRKKAHVGVQKAANWVIGLFIAGFAFGIINLLAGAPIWMQLFHLLQADGLWLATIALGAFALGQAREAADEPLPEPKREWPGMKAVVKDYVALTKPRIISLLLFTTLAAMFAAASGWPGGWLLLAVAVGGYFAAGAANALNMVYERDLDTAMERTATRPTAAQRISSRAALIFAGILAVASFTILTLAANVLTALLAQAGLLFYVLIYTMALKRRTWQNIVIGGAAGAFPPLVGWAAVTGQLNTYAWFLFALIFLWTPVHFWALAILIKDDYAKAGVPMLPVVKGERATVIQIGVYAVLTTLVCVVPFFQHQVGITYVIGALVLNAALLTQTAALMRHTTPPRAKALFKYSMVYLALMFVVVAADRAMLMGGAA